MTTLVVVPPYMLCDCVVPVSRWVPPRPINRQLAKRTVRDTSKKKVCDGKKEADDESGIRTHALSDYGIALHDGDDVIKEYP